MVKRMGNGKMRIRLYVKYNDYLQEIGFKIVGPLTRCEDYNGCRHYVDEAGNEFYLSKYDVCVVGADGVVLD